MNRTYRVLAALLLLALCASFVACGSIEVEYYTNTDIPTFTCVTGVDGYLSSQSTSSMRIYVYDCAENQKEKLAKKYIQYLKNEQGYASVSSDDGYDFVTLAKGNWGVIVDTNQTAAVQVLPYYRTY